ncbi:acetylcholinesterase-like [Saccostrea cucullata]|uniref:acetylcholinesterase-like n=1 Tax=Saccostrea cuccullata TaxID=36930 RepID=UPI002ED2DD38
MLRYLLTTFLSIISLPVYTSKTLVETTSGFVRGFTQDVDGTTVYTYLGIPFAQPPLGELRFRRPVPIEKWTDVFNATSLGNTCFQSPLEYFKGKKGEKSEEMWNPNTNMSEDCLHLNIWVPKVSGDTKLTTMVWIYGGGFIAGSPTLDLYDGAMLASSQQVIVISINYRLGPLGFLYLGTENAPGNMGLLDQQLALHWIHSNIQLFGGSQDDITLFGESAGAVSISYHIMANHSRNLFKNAILQSASALAHWAYNDPKVALEYTVKLAEAFDCESNDETSVIECLKTKDASEFFTKIWTLPLTAVTFNFVPTLDNYFIFETPSDFFSSGILPAKRILLGVNRNEAMYFLFYSLYDIIVTDWPNNTLKKDDYIKNLPECVSQNGIHKLDNVKDKLIIDAILYRYESHLLPGDKKDYMMLLDDITGDFAFKCPTINLAQKYAQANGQAAGVYLYEFNHRPSVSSWPEWSGALHGDEIEFIFGLPLRKGTKYSANEQSLSQDMMQYWAKFAKTGRPSSDWPPYSFENEAYRKFSADVGPYDSVYNKGLKHSHCLFWNDYIPKLQEYLKQEDVRCECATNIGHRNSTNFITHALITIIVIICTSILFLVR